LVLVRTDTAPWTALNPIEEITLLHTLLAWMAAWIIAVISTTGYLGIALLMAIESACIPLPSEIIMPFSGYLVSTGRFDLLLVATAGALGCNLGSTVAYFVGIRGGRRWVERWGSYILVSRRDLDMAERFFARYGSAAIFIARLLPVVRTFISLPAGIARMPQLKFQIYTFLGSWPWCFGLAYVGEKLGDKWNNDPELRSLLHQADAVIVAVIVAGVAWHVWRHFRHAREDR
jgi:membrane protein DedA with SNARE-associated domain